MKVWRRPQIVMLFVSCLLLAATFARPTLDLERDTYRYVFVFDISQSMNVADVPNLKEPISRLAYAKKMAVESMSMLPCGSEVGLALFTGHRAFLLITPTEICANYRELSAILHNIDWTMTWEARSEIAKGLYKSIGLMHQLAEQTRLVFLTDGHEAPPINPDLPPRYTASETAIYGLIVGVGGDQPVPIPKFDNIGEQQGYWQADDVAHIDAYSEARNAREGKTSGAAGTEHLSSLRESYLESLATKTGLGYHRLRDAKNLSRELRREALGIPNIITTDMRWALAFCALVLFLAAMLLVPSSTPRRASS